MPLSFSFDEGKATEATAWLLHRHGRPMKYLRMIKLLYFADRESIRRYGRPIVGDRYVAMHHGPVLSCLYDIIKLADADAREAHPEWARSIRRVGYFLRLRQQPQYRWLSPADIEILEGVSTQYAGWNTWSVRDLSHQVPEWTDPGKTSRRITLPDLLRHLGFEREQIRQISLSAYEKDFLDGLFGT